MSKHLKLEWTHHRLAIQNSLRVLFRKPISALMTVVVIALSLTIPVLFWAFTNSLSGIMNYWRTGSHIILYLDTGLSSAEQTHVLNLVLSHQQVGEATLKTPEEGLKELEQQGDIRDVLQYLPDNPLPAVIDAIPAVTLQNPTDIQVLSEQLKALPHVELMKLDIDWVNQSHAIFGFLQYVTYVLILLFSVATIFMISNTLRLILQTRHEEIHILQLVGAADNYIMRPFLYLGVWYGLAGACLTLVLTQSVITSFSSHFKQVHLLYQMHLPGVTLSWLQVTLLLLLTSWFGWIAARVSVKRQLVLIASAC